jgi:predicted Zn-dependent protease
MQCVAVLRPGKSASILSVMKNWICSAAVAAFLMLAGCATVPETGRSQLILISADDEMRMGVSAFEEIKKQQPISKDSAALARVQKVGTRIAPVVGRDLPGARWEFVVFESDQVNAFALPGGKVGVYTGLLKLADNDNELAAVIAHEIAHVSARHGAERTSQQMGAALLGTGVSIASNDSRYRDQIRLAYGLAATGTILKYSRDHESEADRIGLLYMARAGYDPQGALSFWRKMAARNQGPKPIEWLSTHPSDQTRIQRIQNWLPEMQAVYQANRR